MQKIKNFFNGFRRDENDPLKWREEDTAIMIANFVFWIILICGVYFLFPKDEKVIEENSTTVAFAQSTITVNDTEYPTEDIDTYIIEMSADKTEYIIIFKNGNEVRYTEFAN